MSEELIFNSLLIAWFTLPIPVSRLLFSAPAPYGRHTRKGFGPLIDRRLGWMMMELPAVVVYALLFVFGNRTALLLPIGFLVLWQTHYLHRTFIFPFRMRGGKKQMTLVPVCLGFIFNLMNGYLNGRYLYTLGPAYPVNWTTDPRFIAGTLMFVVGFILNQRSDEVLRHLRKPGDTGYQIPRVGMFKLVSCPNYLGEIIEWCGWAMATWSLPGLAFASWTAANLVPRAWAHHRWYRRQFADYPKQRKALIPFVF